MEFKKIIKKNDDEYVKKLKKIQTNFKINFKKTE